MDQTSVVLNVASSMPSGVGVASQVWGGGAKSCVATFLHAWHAFTIRVHTESCSSLSIGKYWLTLSNQLPRRWLPFGDGMFF